MVFPSVTVCMIISCFLSSLSMTVKVAQRMFTAPPSIIINPYWHLIHISIDTWLTSHTILGHHYTSTLTNTWLTVDWLLCIDRQHSMATFDLLLTEMLSKTSVDWVAIEMSTDFQSRFWSSVDWDANHVMIEMSIKGINWCSTTVAFHTHHPKILVKNLWKFSSRTFWILARILKGFQRFCSKIISNVICLL